MAWGDWIHTFDLPVKIIDADPVDADRIREIYLSAFDEAERETVAELAIALLAEKSEPRPIHLVADIDGKLVGHVSFSPVRRKENGDYVGQILAPLAVSPGWQKRGVGSALVEEGLRRIKGQEGGIVFVYGDPAYYQRFGFVPERAENFLPPCPLTHPFGWQALVADGCEIPDRPVSIECVGPLCSPELW